jgi:fibronectin-binding autotransporter adhesin
VGQLTNLYVSSSYQGLLKLTDSTQGLQPTLQTVQDGLGGNSPLQISQTEVNISGTFTVNGAPVSVNTGSLVTTSSFNAYTSSVNTKLAGLDVETGSLQLQINSKLNSSSFNSYTSSNDARVNSLISQTGSYVTETESGSFMITGSVAGDTLTFTKGNGSQFSLQVNTGSLPSGVVSGSAQIVDLGFATTSSVNSLSSSIATTDLNQNNVIAGLATTSSLTSLSSSIASTDLGQNNRLGSLETATGSLQNQINQKLDSSSFNSYTSSNDGRVSSLESKTGSYATTGSNVFQGTQTITGSLDVTGTITALSASITYLETIYQTSSIIFSSGSNILGDEAGDTQTLNGQVNIPLGNLNITGATTSSLGFFGNLQGTASYATQALSASYAPQDPLPSGLVSGSAQISYTGITDVPSGIISGSVQISDLGFATTSSVNQKLDTGSFNTYSGDTLNLINQKLDSSSFNSYTSSNDSKVNSLISQTGSYVTEAESGSFMITGSVAGDTLTFTKGDGSQFSLQVNTGSLPSGLVSGSSQISYTGITDVPNGIVSSSAQVSFTGITDVPSGLVSGSGQISDLGFATTGSNTFRGDQVISGSLLGSTLNDGQIRIFSDTFNSGAVKMNISSSAPSAQSNIIFGGAVSPTPSQQTGSIVISGSNNIVMGGPRPNTLLTQGTYGYLGGNINIFAGQSTLNTGSSYRPLMNSNVNFGNIAMTLGSGSNNFNISSNALIGGTLILNMPSASIGGGMATNIIAGQVTLQQSQAIPLASSSISPAFNTNNVNGTFNLQTNSGSFQVVNNNINGNNVSVTSSYRATTAAQNAITLNNNSINGLNHRILLDGVAATTKGFSNNLIVGANNTGSMVTNDTNGISNTGLIGQGLHVESGNISGTGGSLIVGRFNGTGSLSNPGFVKFAVGTGNSNTNRRTTLWVDENSKVSVSGSLDISGSVNISGSAIRTNNFLIYDGSPNEAGAMTNFVSSFMNDRNTFTFNNIVQSQLSTGSNFSLITNTGSTLTQINFKSAYAGTETQFTVGNFNGSRNIDFKTDRMTVTGSLNVTGSVSIADAGDLTMYGHKMFNVGTFYDTTTQSGSANVSQSINYNTTDISQGVTVASNSRLTVTNAGTYNIQFSAQLEADGGSDNVFIWFKKNGTNIAGSASEVELDIIKKIL